MNDRHPESSALALPADQAEERAARLKAIGLMCIAVSMFGCLDATAKYLVTLGGLPVTEVVAMRMVTNMLLVLLTFPLVFGPRSLARVVRTARPLQQIFRSLCMIGATAFNFMAVKYLQLDQTITIFYMAPLLVALLAGPLLGEWIGWRRTLAIIAGFLGVLLVTRPGFGGIHWAFLLSIAAAVSYSFYNITTRYLARHDATEVTLFYTPMMGALMMLPFLVFDWHWPHSPMQWVLLFLLGALGGGGHWLLIIAHRSAPAPILAPFSYSNLLTVILLGYFIFGDLPTLWTLAGGLIVIGSGLYIFNREREVGRPAPVPPVT